MRRVWSTSDPCVFGVGAEKRPAYCDVRSAGIVTLCCPRLCVHLPRARISLFIVGPIPVNIYRVPSSLPPLATENGNLYQAGKFIKRDFFFLFSLFIGQGWRKMKYGWRRRFGVFLLEIEEARINLLSIKLGTKGSWKRNLNAENLKIFFVSLFDRERSSESSFIEYSSTDLNSKRRIFHENQCCNGVEHATIRSRFQTGSNGLQHICVTMSCTQRSVNKLLQTHSRRIYISRSVTQYSWRNTINNSRMRIDLSINLFERNHHRL